jgi:hypothetical protein
LCCLFLLGERLRCLRGGCGRVGLRGGELITLGAFA